MQEFTIEMLGAGLFGLAYLTFHGSTGPWWMTALQWTLAIALTVSGVADWLRLRRRKAADRNG